MNSIELEINEIKGKNGEFVMRTHNHCCTEGFRLEIEAGTLTNDECVPTQKIAAHNLTLQAVLSQNIFCFLSSSGIEPATPHVIRSSISKKNKKTDLVENRTRDFHGRLYSTVDFNQNDLWNCQTKTAVLYF